MAIESNLLLLPALTLTFSSCQKAARPNIVIIFYSIGNLRGLKNELSALLGKLREEERSTPLVRAK